MKKRVSLTRALTFGMAVLSLPTLALAQAVSVQLGNTGEHTGAGVVVPVTVACMDYSRGADIEVQLVQDAPNGQATGEGDIAFLATAPCPSTPQTVHVLVMPGSGSPSFSVGEARARADLDGCDASFQNCNDLIDNRNINVGD
jgi:hypothetical protein